MADTQTAIADGSDSRLALWGGKPVVQQPAPHFRWPLIDREVQEAVMDELVHGPLSYPRSGGRVRELEEAFAAFHGMPLSLTTHSGTGALHAAFFGLGLAPGDEVLVPAYTHIGSALPIFQCNLVPVLCDVCEDTGNLDPDEISARMTDRTRAVVVTHQYGHVCDMARILDLTKQHGLSVVEDCSHAHGASLDSQLAGTFGDVACFSLQAHKTMVAGEGGILLTRDERVYERATLLGHFRRPRDESDSQLAMFCETGYGLKNRLHPLGAAVALVYFRRLPEIIAQRRENLTYFEQRLREVPGVDPLPTAPGADRGGYFRFLVKYNGEKVSGVPIEAYFEALRAEGVAQVNPGWMARPLHTYPIFQTLEDGMYPGGWSRQGPHISQPRVYRAGDFPRAERFSSTTLQFPAFTEPSKPIIDAYIDAMYKVASHADELQQWADQRSGVNV